MNTIIQIILISPICHLKVFELLFITIFTRM